jgi:hypothetical protein
LGAAVPACPVTPSVAGSSARLPVCHRTATALPSVNEPPVTSRAGAAACTTASPTGRRSSPCRCTRHPGGWSTSAAAPGTCCGCWPAVPAGNRAGGHRSGAVHDRGCQTRGQLQPVGPVLDAGGSGEDQDAAGRAVAHQPAADAVAVHGRRVAVEDDHVVAGAGHALQGCRAVVDPSTAKPGSRGPSPIPLASAT